RPGPGLREPVITLLTDRPLAGFKALTFDCYGTLVDWERGLLEVLRPWAVRHRPSTTDASLLEAFARAEPVAESRNPDWPYPEILRSAHTLMARDLGLPEDEAAADEIAASVGQWPAFPDTVEALARLQRRYLLAVVSNVDRVSFEATRRRLGIEFGAVITAQDVGAYKPDLRMFRRALDELSRRAIEPHAVLHVAQSLYHDHVPAKRLGLCTVWVDRRRGREGGGATPVPAGAVRPDWTVSSLAELAQRVERAFGAPARPGTPEPV
ncbi:MAG TPA: HAD-IA family hydrolase, partial [Candidatus Polarisedimenticolia bacterium]|nr:HAD-IA family hydrolase [Candidatus Polarisedimenticolia bacterium]